MGYRRVLVGTDGSPTASTAVRHAARLAAASGAELVVVTAYARDAVHERELAQERELAPDDVRWAITGSGEAEELLAEAKRIVAEQADLRLRSRAEPGDAANVLIATAEELQCDVIVLGNRGLSSPGRFLLGSVPGKVSHHAPCDVLIVPTT